MTLWPKNLFNKQNIYMSDEREEIELRHKAANYDTPIRRVGRHIYMHSDDRLS